MRGEWMRGQEGQGEGEVIWLRVGMVPPYQFFEAGTEEDNPLITFGEWREASAKAGDNEQL